MYCGSCELTCWGRSEAEELGTEWTNVRIDQLYSSTLVRALDTARQIAKYNQVTPEIEQSEQIVKRYLGTACAQYIKEDNEAAFRKEIMVVKNGLPLRDHRPGGGGESFEDVAKRGRQFMEKEILGKFVVPLTRSLDSFAHLKQTRSAEIPPELEGIPHVVVISHNIFLNELYEGMECWYEGEVDTRAEWRNAGWCV